MSKQAKELTLEARTEYLNDVLGFVDAELEGYDCPPRVQVPLDVAVEELYLNIASYAYQPDTGPATVRVEVSDAPITVTVTFVDHGMQYDPLSREDPDLDLDIEERRIGGLGIFMVKNCMDEVNYEYRDGQNILTIRKQIEIEE